MAAPKTPPRTPLYKSRYVQVLVAVTIGVLLGHLSPDLGAQMKPLSDVGVYQWQAWR